MKIGMLTGLWYVAGQATLVESLQRAAALGFRYVDLHGVFHAGPAQLSWQARHQVKVELETLRLKARNYVLHSPHNPACASAAQLAASFEYLREGLDLCALWGINQLMLNPGQWVYGVPRQQAWENALRFIQTVCDDAASRGIFIALEAEPYVWFLVNDIPSTVHMLADVDRENFSVLVDLGHMGLSRESPADLAQLGDRIIHAHFSDHEQFRHTNQVIGTGVTPTADYLEWLREMDIDRQVRRFGYDDLVVSFELGAPSDQIPDPDDRVRRSLDYVRQIAPFMSLV
jgi:sugar phosphate isomerase/epimerase